MAASVLAQVDALNRDGAAAAPSGRVAAPGTIVGSTGVVLGATVDLADFGIDITAPASTVVTPVLAPGFGHQGANPADLTSLFGGYAQGVIVSESRSVLSAGPERVADEITRRVTESGATRG